MSTRSHWKNYVGGEWIGARSGAELAVIDPSSAQTFAHAPQSSAADIDEAVAAARAAFRTRALYDMKPAARAKLLYDIAAELRKLGDEIVPLMTEENGKSLGFSQDEVDGTARYFEYYAGIADKVHGRSIPLGAGYTDYTQLVPLGVSGQIVPWNFPL
jgi:aldehyde dehydrogenase (NAD+)